VPTATDNIWPRSSPDPRLGGLAISIWRDPPDWGPDRRLVGAFLRIQRAETVV